MMTRRIMDIKARAARSKGGGHASLISSTSYDKLISYYFTNHKILFLEINTMLGNWYLARI